MKNYTITVNGNVYDVTVEEGTGSAAPAAKAAAPKAAPKAAAKAAAPAGAFYCALGSDSDRRTEHTAELPVQLDRAVLSLGDQLDWHAGSDADVIHGENFVSAGGL